MMLIPASTVWVLVSGTEEEGAGSGALSLMVWPFRNLAPSTGETGLPKGLVLQVPPETGSILGQEAGTKVGPPRCPSSALFPTSSNPASGPVLTGQLGRCHAAVALGGKGEM